MFPREDSFMWILLTNGNTLTKIIYNISFPLTKIEILLKDSNYLMKESGFTKKLTKTFTHFWNGRKLMKYFLCKISDSFKEWGSVRYDAGRQEK